MPYEWDDEKSEKNRRERGFGFDIMDGFNWSFALCYSVQQHGDEEREMWIGPIGDDLYVVIITKRGSNTRIISLRFATQPEINEWRKEFQNG